MASFHFHNGTFTINLNGKERRALARPKLLIEKSRLIAMELAEYPGKAALGIKTSKAALFSGILGEFRSGSKKILVLGKLRGRSGLKIKVSHPNFDEIWVFGHEVAELEQQLVDFLKSK